MRDVKRLDRFYREVKRIHKEFFPDWRFGQLMVNFLAWIYGEKRRDPFFPEEDEMIKLLNEFTVQTVQTSSLK